MTNYDQHGVRTQNRRNVLDYIATKGIVSRQEIVEHTGSSMTTVLAITDFLIKKHIITVEGEIKTARGRHPQRLKYNPDGIKAIAIEYDGKNAKVALCNALGEELSFIESEVSDDIRVFFREELPPLVKSVAPMTRTILGAGISMSGDFSPDGEFFIFGAPSEIKGIDEFSSLKKEFCENIGLNLYCYNDGNAAAWGEFLKRGRLDDDLVFIYVGEGIGSGLILDGKLRTGNKFAAGEIGYMVYDPDFRTSNARAGWFEQNLSNDKGQDKCENVEKLISLAIANVSNVLDVQTFVVKSFLGDASLDHIQKIVDKLSLNPVNIVAPLCRHSALSGVATLVLNEEINKILE